MLSLSIYAIVVCFSCQFVDSIVSHIDACNQRFKTLLIAADTINKNLARRGLTGGQEGYNFPGVESMGAQKGPNNVASTSQEWEHKWCWEL